MIEIHSWHSQIANKIDFSNLSKKYDVTYTGIENYDERGDWADSYISNISKAVLEVSYSSEQVALNIDSELFSIRSFNQYNIPAGKCLIDATSLALPELVHLFSIFKLKKRSFDVIYVQPNGYNEKQDKGIDKVRTFDLSDDGLGVQQLPPFVGFTSDSSILIFLGFEGHRVGALIHSEEYNTENATCLVGVPAFKLGWENTTLSNNYKQLSELSNNMRARFRFSGANDPLKTYETIELMYSSLKYERKRLCLAPFGTKPAAIAAAQFAVNNDGIIIAYDFVKKKKRRSEGTDLVHIWSFNYVGK